MHDWVNSYYPVLKEDIDYTYNKNKNQIKLLFDLGEGQYVEISYKFKKRSIYQAGISDDIMLFDGIWNIGFEGSYYKASPEEKAFAFKYYPEVYKGGIFSRLNLFNDSFLKLNYTYQQAKLNYKNYALLMHNYHSYNFLAFGGANYSVNNDKQLVIQYPTGSSRPTEYNLNYYDKLVISIYGDNNNEKFTIQLDYDHEFEVTIDWEGWKDIYFDLSRDINRIDRIEYLIESVSPGEIIVGDLGVTINKKNYNDAYDANLFLDFNYFSLKLDYEAVSPEYFYLNSIFSRKEMLRGRIEIPFAKYFISGAGFENSQNDFFNYIAYFSIEQLSFFSALLRYREYMPQWYKNMSYGRDYYADFKFDIKQKWKIYFNNLFSEHYYYYLADWYKGNAGLLFRANHNHSILLDTRYYYSEYYYYSGNTIYNHMKYLLKYKFSYDFIIPSLKSCLIWGTAKDHNSAIEIVPQYMLFQTYINSHLENSRHEASLNFALFIKPSLEFFIDNKYEWKNDYWNYSESDFNRRLDYYRFHTFSMGCRIQI